MDWGTAGEARPSRPPPRLRRVAELKSVYLIHGDDDAKIDEWRTRLRRRAETELGPGGLESFDARATGPDQLAAALATLTFATGTRYLLADDASAWKAGSPRAALERARRACPRTRCSC